MKRFLAHVIIEAKTPLKVGGGKNDLFYNAPVQRDFNDLPMILGTSVAGILRRAFEESAEKEATNEIFGTKDEKEIANQYGSKLIASNALLVDEKGKVCEGPLLQKSEFIKKFDILPIREHVAISANGTAKDTGKFDEEIVFKGSRFKFSLEFMGAKDKFEKILNLFFDPALRLGGGSSRGFGELAIYKIKWGEFELSEYSSSLNFNSDKFGDFKTEEKINQNFIRYELKISPDDFFMFGSGFGDSEADHTQAFECVIDYENKCLSERKILIPASSIKGALSHRTAFHFNKINRQFGEEAKVGSENKAVREIFGNEKSKNENGTKGKILLSDCFLDYDEQKEVKVFEHVSIDRFTGGAIDGALFQEKTVVKRDQFTIEILLKKDACDDAKKAFERALNDVVNGRLLLGGTTAKGHGFFKGKAIKNGKELELKNEEK